MDQLLVSTAVGFGVIFAAELGDKSQLMALTFATRYRPWPIIAAITVATGAVHLASVVLGAAVGAALPTTAVAVAAGLAFIGFGVWTFRGDSLDEDEEERASRTGRSVFVTVAVAFVLAELGDKTMLATVTLAARDESFWEYAGTWLGSTVGMVAADALAIVLGYHLGRRLPERAVALGAGALFVLIGVWLLVDALLLG
ncbi:TMEM165/GDT1 family protein [uncultured Pseudokineococcus sp.]|uniref:TMEM165/GDT1 family protein n=1 Tax=uncultured Pseudokineococcus sp. TaxID=1642928 RepID=UPI00262CD706|nr:TMEM165/GDT1 family protein [uncultured Pseudokineococcus sp.]